MGTCGYEESRPSIIKLESFHSLYLHDSSVMANPQCDRFGQVQNLLTKKAGIYRFIMAAKLGKHTVKMETINIQCRIMNSIADFQLYDGANFELQTKISPIFDHYDKSNSQVYFHITNVGKHNYLTKIYQFDSFRDVRFKQGLYQISLYQSLAQSQLVDHFIMNRGTLSALVIVYKFFQTTLLDIMQYRKEAQGYGWTETEVLYIWMKLIKSYRQLRENNIFHRDLRLGNIFFTPANTTEPFHFLNLSSARRIESSQLEQQDRELLTVRGVNCFAESLKGNIEAGQQLGDYDPHQHDITCLVRVLLSVLNLDPLEQSKHCANQKLQPLLVRLRSAQTIKDLAQIQNSIQLILNETKTQTSTGTGTGVNVNTILGTDKEISQELSKHLLPRYHHQKIQKVYLSYLLLLHKRETFNKYLVQKMQENEKADKKQLNLQLLHQIGQYYQNVGIPDNEYYKEQITLVINLAKEFRLEHLMQNNQRYIQKAMVLIEKYRYRGQDLRIRLKIQVIYSCLEAGDINQANQQLATLVAMTQKESTLQLQFQAQVLLTKAMVETTCYLWELAEASLQKARLIIKDGRNFVTQNQERKIKGDLLMVEGYHYLRYLKERRDQIPKTKYFGLAEASITGALQVFTNLPQNPIIIIRVVDAYLLQAGLQIERERFGQAKKSLDAANLLLQELEAKHPVSMNLRRVVYQKLKLVTNPTDQSYNTVCRRLNHFNDTGLTNRDTHLRLMSQLSESKRQQKQIRMLEKSIIITQEREELQYQIK